MRRDGWLSRTAFAVLSLLLAGTMWVVPYLPTNDGPDWAFGAHVVGHYGDPGTVYRDVFIPALQFAARGFTMLDGPLDVWFGWQRGLQLALTVTLLALAWGFAAVVREIAPNRWALGFLGFPLALSWEFYMGLWAFVVSSAIGLFVLALAVRQREPGWKGRVLLSLLLLAQAIAHVFGAVLTGFAILVLAVARARKGRRLVDIGSVLLTGLPASGVLVACVLASRNLSRIPLLEGFERFSWSDVALMLPRTVAPGPLARAIVVTLGVGAAAVLAVVRAGRRSTGADDRGLGVAAIVLLLAGLFAPFQIPGWQAFSQRFIPLGVALTLAVLPLERLDGALRQWSAPALFAISALWVGLSYPFHLRLVQLCPDAVAGLWSGVRLAGPTLTVSLRGTELPVYDRIRAEVPLMAPLRHMDSLYATALGGVPAYSFGSSPAINPFEPRAPPSRPLPDAERYLRAINSLEFHRDLGFRQTIDNELASFGVFYDEALVFGALPEDLAVWRERGYVTDWAEGTALVAHFEPCTIDFTVAANARDPGPVFDVHVGALGLLSGVRVPSVVEADALAHFRLMPAPCGVVSLRATWASRPGGDALRCRNAKPDGDLEARITRSLHRIDCEVHSAEQ